MRKRSPLSSALRCNVLVLAAYVILSLAFCYPLPLRLGTDVAGRYVDVRIFQWNNWWVKHALFSGQNLNYTDYIYYPSGASLVSHNFNWVSSFLSVPLDLLFGPIVAYNVGFLLTFFLSAFSAYLLVRYLTKRWDAAFIGGLVFAFSAYHVSGNFDGQMNLANVQWLPLFALYLLRTVDGRTVVDSLLTGLFFALASLDCWFFALFLGIWMALFLAYSLALEWKKWSWRLVGLLSLAAVVSLLVMSPFLLPLIRESIQGSVSGALAYYSDDKSTDLLAFVVPSSDHPLLGPLVDPIYRQFQHWRPAFLGYSALLLAAYTAFVPRRRSALWTISGLLFASLALGTELNVKGIAYPAIPMPLRGLITLVPVLKIIRQASRFNVMVTLSLAVLVGLGWADILDRVTTGVPGSRVGERTLPSWRRWAIVLLGSGLLTFEYLALPCPLSTAQVSPFYRALAQEEGQFALLELPIDDFHSREYLYPQTVHHKKLVNGYVARTPAGARGFMSSSPLIKAAQIQMEVDPALYEIPREIGLLAANDIRYVILHKQQLPPQPPVDPAVLDSWRTLFGPHAEYEDSEIAVYRTRLAPGQSLATITDLSDALGLTEVRAQRTRMPAEGEQFLAIDLTWKALRAIDRDYACRVSLAGEDGMLASAEAELISPRYPTSRWPAGVFVAERYAIPIDATLQGGLYTLTIDVTDVESGETVGRSSHSVRVSSQAAPFVPALDSARFPADVTFGQRLWLLGYTPRQEGNELFLDVYWQAMQVMDRNYKVFVHLLRPDDQVIVTQVDTMPRNWSYPTSLWARREVYIDRLTLDLSGVEAGTYRLAVGVYDPQNGRLTALDADDRPIADNRAILPDLIEIATP